MKYHVPAFLLLFTVFTSGAVEHPFILWTRDEAAAIRKRIETEPWAKSEYSAMLGDKDAKGQRSI